MGKLLRSENLTHYAPWARLRNKRRRTIYEPTDYCVDSDYSLWRFGVLAGDALHAPFTYTNGLYGRKTFMPLPRFTAGLLLFSERSDGDVINLCSC